MTDKMTTGPCVAWRPEDGTMRGMCKGAVDDVAILDPDNNMVYGILYGGYPDCKKAQKVFLAAPELLHELIRLRDILKRNNWGTDYTDKVIASAQTTQHTQIIEAIQND